MKLSLRSRIYLGILPLLLLFLGIMYFLILDVRGLYQNTQEISFANLDLSQNLTEIQTTLSAMEVLLDEGDGYRARQRDRVTLNRLSVRIARSSESIQLSTLQNKLNRLMFDVGGYDGKLKEIEVLAQKLSEGKGDPAELYSVIREASDWTIRLRGSVDQFLEKTQSQIEDRAEIVYSVVIGGMLVAIALTLAISTVLWLRMVRPIEAMTEGLEQFGSDSEQLDIDYNEDDELGYLARSLEGMTGRLKEYQDLTNQKLIRSTSAIRSILDHSPDAFFILTSEFIPVYSSPSAQKLSLESVLKNALPEEVQDKFKDTLKAGKPHLSKELKDAIRIVIDGEDKWFLVHVFPIDAPDGNDFSYDHESSLHNVAAIFQEVTLLKLSDRLRKDLLATVSHELKTPITSARISLYLLLEQQLGPLNEDQVELLETARDDVNRQLATIEHLLDLSRIEENVDDLEFEEFTISSLVSESLDAHSELCASSGVTLEFTPSKNPIRVVADEAKLRIVLNNFVVNAIKYCGAGKHVEVRVFSEGEMCRVEVIDNGPGMDEDTVRMIFNVYTRGSSSGGVAGNGLGLKISKDIIDAHGGRIGCQSKLDVGSTFFFEVPLKQS